MRSRRYFAMIAALMSFTDDRVRMPRIRKRKPDLYFVHLTKAERKGKTWEEIQDLRRQRARGA